MKTSLSLLFAFAAVVVSAGNHKPTTLSVGPAIAAAGSRAALQEDRLEATVAPDSTPTNKAVAAEEPGPAKAKAPKRMLPSRAQLWLT
ncbi:MAG: hypothetical protein JNN01_13950 [Opitutaceae bacterium]|nr:hypothetical protein [Opitutaceae bacterium]